MSTPRITLSPPDAQGISHLVFEHPGKHNALTRSMWVQLRALIEPLVREPGPTRVIVLRGAGGQFVAGADIEEFPDFRFTPERLAQYHEELVAPALQALLDCDVPLVAHIEGACVGGGLEIAACCDLRLCEPASRFGVPIARLGFPMAPAEVEIVSRVIGPTLLRELLIDARLLDADEARQRGLVSRVLPADELAAEVARTAARIAALSPQAMRLNKRALRQFGGPLPSAAEQRRPHYDYADSAEHREGLAAFIDKRPARF